jgi:hypothetical protein
MLKVVLFLCVAAAFAAAAPKKNADVEKTIKSQLVKQAFTTKILVGGHIPCPPNVNTNGHDDAIKPVDTELSMNGSIQYYARANCFYSSAPGVIDLGVIFDATRFYVTGGLSSQIDPGTSVLVRSVDFKEDRIEVNVIMNGGTSAGKIKYMMGTEYRTWPVDQVMEVIARGLVIPAYEKLSNLNSQYNMLGGQLDEAERKYNAPGGDAAVKLRGAISLRQVLEKLQKNRADYTALGKSDPQAGIYTDKLKALKPEIVRLTEEARKDRVAQVRNELQSQLAELTEVQNQVRQKPPSSMAEWEQRTESVTVYSRIIYNRQSLFARLRNDNEAPSPEDAKNLDESSAEIGRVKQELEQSHQKLQLADLNTQYGKLKTDRQKMFDAYMRVFGTAKEKSALQNFIVVLDKIVANREQAAGLGDKTAATQLTQCRAEAAKYRRK